MNRLPLEDVRIIDFGWVMACPHGTRLLADLGAEVIKVESKAKVDGLRREFPREGVTSMLEEGGGPFNEQNRNKLGISLNVKTPRGKEILGRLVKVADVVASNFDPKGFRKLGLGYEKLREYNPAIIVVNASGMGDYGPHSEYMTLGPNLEAISGIAGTVGYPRQEFVGLSIPWIDYMGGAALALAVLAALEYRKKSGKGQFIDISQHEVALSFLGSILLDWSANNKIRENSGNHQPSNKAAPHNCYRCKGKERWCVISVATDEEWDNFCRVMSLDWTGEPRFATHLQRILHQDELDKLTEEWTINYSPEEVVERMQNAGVSAGVVKNIIDVMQDPNLKDRGFLIKTSLPHPQRKPSSFIVPGIITKLMGQSLSVRRTAPGPLGQDNDYVLKNIVGMTEQEIHQASAEGAFD